MNSKSRGQGGRFVVVGTKNFLPGPFMRITRIGIVANAEKPKSPDYALRLADWGRRRGLEILLEDLENGIKRSWAKSGIGIQEDDMFSFMDRETLIPRARETEITSILDDHRLWLVLTDLLDTVIRRPIVNDDDFNRDSASGRIRMDRLNGLEGHLSSVPVDQKDTEDGLIHGR